MAGSKLRGFNHPRQHFWQKGVRLGAGILPNHDFRISPVSLLSHYWVRAFADKSSFDQFVRNFVRRRAVRGVERKFLKNVYYHSKVRRQHFTWIVEKWKSIIIRIERTEKWDRFESFVPQEPHNRSMENDFPCIRVLRPSDDELRWWTSWVTFRLIPSEDSNSMSLNFNWKRRQAD